MNQTPGKSLRQIKRNAWQALALPFILFLSIPILALLLRFSPGAFAFRLQQEQVAQAIRLSLLTSGISCLLTLIFGTPLAYLLHHRRRGIYRLVDTLVDLPTVLPPAVAGVALLLAFGRGGLVGAGLNRLGVTIPFTLMAVVMAQCFIAAPLYIKSAAVGFAAVDCELKKAAALDGASRWQTFRYILVPASWNALLSGIMMTWARALGEFGATIIFAGNFPGRTQTMPLAIYIGFELDLDVAITLSIILIAFSFVVLMLVKWILQRGAAAEPEEDF